MKQIEIVKIEEGNVYFRLHNFNALEIHNITTTIRRCFGLPTRITGYLYRLDYLTAAESFVEWANAYEGGNHVICGHIEGNEDNTIFGLPRITFICSGCRKMVKQEVLGPLPATCSLKCYMEVNNVR